MFIELSEHHKAILTELAELGLSSARDLHARQLAAETPEQAVRLANALHRVSRTIRQTLALETRLERDPIRGDREATDHVVSLDRARLAKRRGQIQAGVERVLWSETEELDAYTDLREDLGELLDIESKDEAFLTHDPDVLIAQLCEQLGFPTAHADSGGGSPSQTAHPREGGDPSGDPAPPPGAIPGSAWIPAFGEERG